MEEAEYKVILVALDGSELAETAIPVAHDLARACDGRLHLARCFVISEDYGIAGPPPADQPKRSGGQHRLEEYKRCEQYLHAIAERIGKDVQIDYSVLHGDAADCLSELASTLPADVLVMTTHGRGGVKRLVLGSVADAMVRRLEVPILMVPAAAGG
jgi:nucleotide-binding universal stress UspA family protein